MNKYSKWYKNLMTKAKRRDHKEIIEYGEKHHIKPRCLGGSNKKSNVVFLTYREHFLAHWLLTKIKKGEERRKMQFALYQLCKIASNHKNKRIVSGWQFEIVRKAKRNSMLGKQIHKGHSHSPETRARISSKLLGHKFYPQKEKYKHTKEACKIMSEKRIQWWCDLTAKERKSFVKKRAEVQFGSVNK